MRCGVRQAGIGKLILTIVGLTILGTVPTAQAGTYVVYGCSLPNGTPAPIDGWTFTNGAAFGGMYSSTCEGPEAADRSMSAWLYTYVWGDPRTST